MHSIRPGQPGRKILTSMLKFTNVTRKLAFQEAGSRKLGFTETVPENWSTQKAGMVSKKCH